ncbi:MAG: hypothetical protein IJV52_05565 [Prevotella sp.]|nr:hypothetical protein [Prevotella sp.]
MTSNCYHFCIADFHVRVLFKESKHNGMHLLSSMQPFVEEEVNTDSLLFQLTVDDEIPVIGKDHRERVGRFDSGNGMTVVDRLEDGGYQYIIKDIYDRECCLLQTNKDFSDCRCALNGNEDMRSFGITNALMIVYAFAGSFQQTLLIHASTILNNGYGYAFIAKSGTGKSTHTQLWIKHIPGSELMNDDNPIVRIVGDQVFIYGSPWSGKTPCYRQIKAPLGAITRIDRAPKNSIEKLSPIEAFASLLPSCSNMKWDKDIFHGICNTVTRVIELTNCYTLHCLPDQEAAEICHKEISR